MPSDQLEEISPESEPRRHAGDPLRYASLGAFALGALAVGALAVVTVSALTRTDVHEPESGPTSTVSSVVTDPAHASETINPVVTQTIAIPFPRLGGLLGITKTAPLPCSPSPVTTVVRGRG